MYLCHFYSNVITVSFIGMTRKMILKGYSERYLSNPFSAMFVECTMSNHPFNPNKPSFKKSTDGKNIVHRLHGGGINIATVSLALPRLVRSFRA